jgi:hypothetical protein
MLTRLSTPSPFPQTPARQTAPAAQRQGFTLALLGKKGIGQKTLDGWKLMEPVTTLEEREKRLIQLTADIDQYSLIHETLIWLWNATSRKTAKNQIKAYISKNNPGLLEFFEEFLKEGASHKKKSIEWRKIKAGKLKDAFIKLHSTVLAMPVS